MYKATFKMFIQIQPQSNTTEAQYYQQTLSELCKVLSTANAVCKKKMEASNSLKCHFLTVTLWNFAVSEMEREKCGRKYR